MLRVLGTIIALTSFVLALDATISNVRWLAVRADQFGIHQWLSVAAPWTILLLATLAVRRWATTPFRSWFLLGCALVAFTFTRLAWVLTFDSHQISDFGRIFRCGIHLASDVYPKSCPSLFGPRALLYSNIAVSWFAPTVEGIEFFNTALHVGTALALAYLSARLYGCAAATVAVIALTLYPDFLYSVTLTSHDNSGIFVLSAFYVLNYLLARRIHRSSTDAPAIKVHDVATILALGALTGFALAALDITRSYHIPAIVALLATAIVLGAAILRIREFGWRRLGLRLAIAASGLIAIPLATASAVDGYVRSTYPDLFIDFLESEALAYVTATEATGSGTYLEMAKWARGNFPKLQMAGRLDFAIRKFVNELGRNPRETVLHFQRKNHNLAEGHGVYVFATSSGGAAPSTKTIKQIIVKSTTQEAFIGSYTLLVSAFFTLRLLLLPWLRFHRNETGVLAFSFALYVVIVFLFEAQPRYDIFLALTFPLLFGHLTSIRSSVLRAHSRTVPPWASIASGAGLLLFGVTAVLTTLKIAASSSYGLYDLTNFRPTTTNSGTVTPLVNRAELTFAASREIPEGALASMSATIQLDGERSIVFFLSGRRTIKESTYPYENHGITYRILVNGRVLADGVMATSSFEHFIAVPAEGGSNGAVELEVQANAARGGPMPRHSPPALVVEFLGVEKQRDSSP